MTDMTEDVLKTLAQRRDSLPLWAKDLLAPWVTLRTWGSGKIDTEVIIPNDPHHIPCPYCGHGQHGTHHRCEGLVTHLHEWIPKLMNKSTPCRISWECRCGQLRSTTIRAEDAAV
jgi:hypothetical protein